MSCIFQSGLSCTLGPGTQGGNLGEQTATVRQETGDDFPWFECLLRDKTSLERAFQCFYFTEDNQSRSFLD